jgi:hypothetical protein
MTALHCTVFRVGNIGSRRYAIGLHPNTKETLLSIRPVGRRVGYVVTLSAMHIQGVVLNLKRHAARDATPHHTGHVLSESTLPLKSRIAILKNKIGALKLCSGNEHKIALREAELEVLEDQARALAEAPHGQEPREPRRAQP